LTIKNLLIEKNKVMYYIIFENNKPFKIIYYPDMEDDDYETLANDLYEKIKDFSNKKLVDLC
jgi:hypothetical protein